MEIHNYTYGVKVKNLSGISFLDFFYGKNIAKLTYLSDSLFRLRDTNQYQIDLTFRRVDVTAITSNGVVVPVPATDDLFFDLIASFFYSTIEPPVNSIVPISGANYNLAIGDNGKTFLFDLPTTPKTFTVPAGLPIGFRCWVVKMYAASNITVTGSGGMAVLGLDPILNGQYARMEIFVTGPLTTLVFNIGG